MSQERVAELVGVSRHAVSKWEIGSANPNTENLMRLAEIYNVSMEQITDTMIMSSQKVDLKKEQNIAHRIFQPIAAYTGLMIAFRIKTKSLDFIYLQQS